MTTDHELLSDVLAEAAPANFDQELLDRTLAEVRRQRRKRRARRGAALLMVAVGLALVWIWQAANERAFSPDPEVAVTFFPPTAGGEGRPLSVKLARTHRLPEAMLVRSAAPVSLWVHSRPDCVEAFSSRPGVELFQVIGDQDLVALTDGRTAVVHIGDDDARLVRLDGRLQ